MMSEEQLKDEKNKSLTVEREALESREFLRSHVYKRKRIRTQPAISIHRNSSEKYILYLEGKLKILEKRLQDYRQK